MVDSQCSQLADAVKGARVALFIALAWSAAWAWSLYSNDLGWLGTERELTQVSYGLSLSDPPGDLFKERCKRVIDLGKRVISPVPEKDMLRVCKETIKLQFDWIEKSYYDQQLMSFPFGFGKISIADLGIAGALGLLLIQSWSFFAFRRENFAIRAIVDMDENSRKLNRLVPPEFRLIPQNPYLSDEHYAFAYHAVSQRFMFIFSQHSRPLILYAMVVALVPLTVASWNLYTDVRDLFHLIPSRSELPVLSEIARLGAQIIVVSVIALISYQLIRIQLDTSNILNGWYLASRDVWMARWDESKHDPAKPVKIFVFTQTAAPDQ